MRIGIGADHAGFALKEHVARRLAEAGVSITDFGTHSEAAVDYPDIAADVAHAVTDGRIDRGIIICGSGAGASIAANKVRGIRAMVAHDTYTAKQGVEHDDVNVLCLGSRVVGQALADELIDAFLAAEFSHDERHARRLAKVIALETRSAESSDA